MRIFNREYRVSIRGTNKVISVPKGATLYQALRDKNIMHTTMCNGKGRCGKCQVQFSADGERISKADRLHVGQLLLNNGYRLACRYSVGHDVEISLPDSSTNNTQQEYDARHNDGGQYDGGAGVGSSASAMSAPSATSPQGMFDYVGGGGAQTPAETASPAVSSASASAPSSAHTIASQAGSSSGATHSSYYRDVPHLAEATIDDITHPEPTASGLTDGIVVYDNGDTVRILQYSAPLDSIINDTTIPVSSLVGYIVPSQDGSASGSEITTASQFLHRVIAEGLLPQVINRMLNIQHSERVICIIREYSEMVTVDVKKNLFGLAFYASESVDGVSIEYLQPLATDTTPSNLEHFLLLSNLHSNGTLVLSTQHTDRVYYYAKSGYYEFSTAPLELPPSLELPEFSATNPIISMHKGIVDVGILDPDMPPNGITFVAMLHCIHILLGRGFLDETYQFYPRSELSERIPLELALKVAAKSKGNLFNIYRDRHSLVSVDGEYIRGVDKYGKAVRALLPLVASEISPLVGIRIYTGASVGDISAFAQYLGIIDKTYHGKLDNVTYDGAMVAINYFSAPSIDDFATRYIKGISCVSISDVPGLAGLIS